VGIGLAMQIVRKALNRFKNFLKLPVDYSREEFRGFKSELDWPSLAAHRCKALARMFQVDQNQVRDLVIEAESISLDEGSLERTGSGHPMGQTDRITLYAAIRLFKPETIVESGTGRGGSTVYILAAIKKNGRGQLFSIDKNPNREQVGCLIPEAMKESLTLCEGDSLVVLPRLRIAKLDCFVHDSTHKSDHMRSEFELASKLFDREGLLCSHDVLKTNAWRLFTGRQVFSDADCVKNLGVMHYKRPPTFPHLRVFPKAPFRRLLKRLDSWSCHRLCGPVGRWIRHHTAIHRERLIVTEWQEQSPGGSFADYYADKQRRVLDRGDSHPTLGEQVERREEKGKAFFALLVEEGLTTDSTCVDFGCGSLRVGQHLIPFLGPQRYIGLDISDDFYPVGLRLLDKRLISVKKPKTSVLSADSIRWASRKEPDFVFANAVLIHVPPSELQLFFSRLRYLSSKHTRVLLHGRVSNRTIQYSPESWSHSRAAIASIVSSMGGHLEYVRTKPFAKLIPFSSKPIETVIIRIVFS
jgi:predicted O-methyltransferase YrrM